MKRKLLIPVIILSLIIVGMFSATLMVTEKQKDDGLLINLAGRQRMLCQKMTKETLQYHSIFTKTSTEPAAVKSSLVLSMEVFDSTLKALTESGQAPLDLKKSAYRQCPKATEPAYSQLVKINGMWSEFSNRIKAVLSHPENADADIEWIMNNNMPLLSELDKSVSMMQKQSERKVILLVRLQLIGVIVAFVFVALFAVLTLSMSSTLNNIIAMLSAASSQVSENSESIASSSQHLADGATRQAASIEESSSALEQLSAMTSQNADNSEKTNQMMKDTNKDVEYANTSMTKLVLSMDEIQKSSEETSRIIKTIDEIAFQTNLLALNAAVEAARAGEAGAGFSVVAGEVRNLAVRSATAAKNTAELIEETLSKVGAGVSMVGVADETFKKVIEASRNVGELIEEISRASSEQAQGIMQINQAISEMNDVVQKTAAISEEAASSAEETSAQAAELTRVVYDIITLVENRKKADEYLRNARMKHPRSTTGHRAEKPVRKQIPHSTTF